MLAAHDVGEEISAVVAVGERISAASTGCGRSNVVTEKKDRSPVLTSFSVKERNCG